MKEVNKTKVIKRNGTITKFDDDKIRLALRPAFKRARVRYSTEITDKICDEILDYIHNKNTDQISVETIQDIAEKVLMKNGYGSVAKEYILYRDERTRIRKQADDNIAFIEKYKRASNTANSTEDPNSNLASKNAAILDSEIRKKENGQTVRRIVTKELDKLFGADGFDSKQYSRDIDSHIIYKHDEKGKSVPVPYCVSTSMYSFLNDGIKNIGGLSVRPKNLDSFCGMYVNYLYCVSSGFLGAVATPEFLLYFDYFARKEWGDDYVDYLDEYARNSKFCTRSIHDQIHQYFQQVIYSINQPSGGRGNQAVFCNFSVFDHDFFEGMFNDFIFPDYSKPKWKTLDWLQKDFMHWFNEERLSCILTFPVISVAMIYKDGKFTDPAMEDFVTQEWAEGDSFFVYISDTVDSLASCCRLRNNITSKQWSSLNGQIGIMTGSKSVITLNLSRIVQDCVKNLCDGNRNFHEIKDKIRYSLCDILERVYKYHIAYNELLWDMKDSHLLPAYDAGFIDLNKQYLTIGINGLNQAAEFLGIQCNVNDDYQELCQFLFGTIKEQNTAHNGYYNNHKLTFNTECVPAEGLGPNNRKWDEDDGYWVPEDTNLYASYIYKPNDADLTVLDKIKLHGRNYIGEYLDGGSAAHLNLSEHLTKEQYKKLLKYAAEEGCQYLTFNVPNSECDDCGFITKHSIDVCPHCGSKHISKYDRIIGYLTKIANWQEARQIEQKTRVYENAQESGVEQL